MAVCPGAQRKLSRRWKSIRWLLYNPQNVEQNHYWSAGVLVSVQDIRAKLLTQTVLYLGSKLITYHVDYSTAINTGIQGDVTVDSNGDRESAYMMKHMEASGVFKVSFLNLRKIATKTGVQRLTHFFFIT